VFFFRACHSTVLLASILSVNNSLIVNSTPPCSIYIHRCGPHASPSRIMWLTCGLKLASPATTDACSNSFFSRGNVQPGRDSDPSPPSSAEVKNRGDRVKPIYLIKYSTCFRHVHCPSSVVSRHCIHAIGICHSSSVGVCSRGQDPDHASSQPTELE
jgi:hypothetical protein